MLFLNSKGGWNAKMLACMLIVSLWQGVLTALFSVYHWKVPLSLRRCELYCFFFFSFWGYPCRLQFCVIIQCWIATKPLWCFLSRSNLIPKQMISQRKNISRWESVRGLRCYMHKSKTWLISCLPCQTLPNISLSNS